MKLSLALFVSGAVETCVGVAWALHSPGTGLALAGVIGMACALLRDDGSSDS